MSIIRHSCRGPSEDCVIADECVDARLETSWHAQDAELYVDFDPVLQALARRRESMKAVRRKREIDRKVRWMLGWFAGFVAFALALTSCKRPAPPGAVVGAAPRELVVFAAASLRDALKELAPSYEKSRGLKLVYNFAGSNDLARQIEASHAADVFLSASEDWMDKVEKAGLVVPGTRITLLSNRLVIIANPTSSVTLKAPEDLATASFEVLALGDPKAVPAGQYAKSWMQGIPVAGGTLWDRVSAKVAPSPDVRAALAMVEAHDGALGIVYRTDVAHSTNVKTLYEVPEASGPKIRYAAAALAGRPEEADAKSFLTFLRNTEARARFEKEGFIVSVP